MPQGEQGVQGRRVESVSSSAAGGVAPVGGPSASPADYCGLCVALAERGPLLSEDERAAFNAMRAREMARAEARRAEPTPQMPLDIAS